MNYIYSIRSGVDERMLSSSIARHRKYKEDMFHDVYVFLNKKTFNDLYMLLNPSCNEKIKKDEKLGFLGYYDGCKMFEDNTLDYGEVELR